MVESVQRRRAATATVSVAESEAKKTMNIEESEDDSDISESSTVVNLLCEYLSVHPITIIFRFDCFLASHSLLFSFCLRLIVAVAIMRLNHMTESESKILLMCRKKLKWLDGFLRCLGRTTDIEIVICQSVLTSADYVRRLDWIHEFRWQSVLHIDKATKSDCLNATARSRKIAFSDPCLIRAI